MAGVIKKTVDVEAGTEIHFAKNNTEYFVAVWDVDCEEYYSPMRMFGDNYDNAESFYNAEAN